MFIHRCEKRIRYGETDKMGFLYYGHYPMLYEIGRVEAIRSLGLSYAFMEDEMDVMMPVVDVHSRYVKPVYYDELIGIETRIEQLPSKMIHFHHAIYNQQKDLVHTGEVKLFFVQKSTGKRVSTPAYLLDKLNAYFVQ